MSKDVPVEIVFFRERGSGNNVVCDVIWPNGQGRLRFTEKGLEDTLNRLPENLKPQFLDLDAKLKAEGRPSSRRLPNNHEQSRGILRKMERSRNELGKALVLPSRGLRTEEEGPGVLDLR